jgi:hypothetical protein
MEQKSKKYYLKKVMCLESTTKVDNLSKDSKEQEKKLSKDGLKPSVKIYDKHGKVVTSI